MARPGLQFDGFIMQLPVSSLAFFPTNWLSVQNADLIFSLDPHQLSLPIKIGLARPGLLHCASIIG